MLTASEARNRTNKFYQQQALRDKFCAYINEIIKDACNHGKYECKVSISDVKNHTDGGLFYKDVLCEYGYNIIKDTPVFCYNTDPANEFYIIKW